MEEEFEKDLTVLEMVLHTTEFAYGWYEFVVFCHEIYEGVKDNGPLTLSLTAWATIIPEMVEYLFYPLYYFMEIDEEIEMWTLFVAYMAVLVDEIHHLVTATVDYMDELPEIIIIAIRVYSYMVIPMEEFIGIEPIIPPFALIMEEEEDAEDFYVLALSLVWRAIEEFVSAAASNASITIEPAVFTSEWDELAIYFELFIFTLGEIVCPGLAFTGEFCISALLFVFLESWAAADIEAGYITAAITAPWLGLLYLYNSEPVEEEDEEDEDDEDEEGEDSDDEEDDEE